MRFCNVQSTLHTGRISPIHYSDSIDLLNKKTTLSFCYQSFNRPALAQEKRWKRRFSKLKKTPHFVGVYVTPRRCLTKSDTV